MRPVLKPQSPRAPRLQTAAGATRSPGDVVRTALQDTIGTYCSFCEMPVFVEEGIASRRARTLTATPTLADWDDLLLVCDWCRYYRRGDVHDPSAYLWPDTDATFCIDDTSPFLYSLRPIRYVVTDADSNVLQTTTRPLAFVAPNPARNDPRAQKTIDLFQLNTPFHDAASDTFSVSASETLVDRRVHLRTEAWGLAEKSIRALRKAREDEDPSSYAALAPLVASLAQATGFWSVWMTALWEAFHDRKLIRDVLLEIDDRNGYVVVGYQTVPDGGTPPWKIFAGTAVDRIAF
jgi:hypothetical protein